MCAIVGCEKQRAVDVREDARGRAGRARPDVANQHGAGGSAVALPEFVPVGAIVGYEKQRAVDVGERGRAEPELPAKMSLTRNVAGTVRSSSCSKAS